MKTKSIEQYRSDYKAHQDRAAVFGITATEFNAKVRSSLHKPTPTPADWVYGAWMVADGITRGRCCPKAEVVPCVCEVSYKCPDHGVRCRGSHD